MLPWHLRSRHQKGPPAPDPDLPETCQAQAQAQGQRKGLGEAMCNLLREEGHRQEGLLLLLLLAKLKQKDSLRKLLAVEVQVQV